MIPIKRIINLLGLFVFFVGLFFMPQSKLVGCLVMQNKVYLLPVILSFFSRGHSRYCSKQIPCTQKTIYTITGCIICFCSPVLLYQKKNSSNEKICRKLFVPMVTLQRHACGCDQTCISDVLQDGSV